MPKTLDFIKKSCLKDNLLKGYSIRQSLKNCGYSPKTAHSKANATTNRCVRVCKQEIEAEFKLSSITPEYVISKVNEIANDPEANHSDKLRAQELLGKFLALWKDKNIQENVNPDKIVISYVNKPLPPITDTIIDKTTNTITPVPIEPIKVNASDLSPSI